jgi:DNA-binding transcriptional ArsR family regulator
MMTDALIPFAAARFKLLGDSVRLSLLATLQAGEKTVTDLARTIRRSQPNVSQHLAALARAGLVEARREGNHVFYRSTDPFVARLCETVCASITARLQSDAKRLGAPAPRPRPVRRRA